VELDPENVEARLSMMEFYLQAPSIVGGDLTKARAEAEAAARIDPVQGLPAVSRVALQQEKPAEAQAAIDRLALVDKGKAHLARASLHTSNEKTRGLAVNELVAVGTDDPKDAEDLTSAGLFLVRLDRPTEALALFEQAHRADPGHLHATYQLGRSLLLSGGALDRAEAAFKGYLAGEPRAGMPSRAAAHWRLGMVYEAQGRKAEARREYEEALRLEPKNKEARKSLDGLKS
jgi:tetratricopeptide (TPR) repeat protein